MIKVGENGVPHTYGDQTNIIVINVVHFKISNVHIRMVGDDYDIVDLNHPD